jgi:hypothetical protein
MLLELVACREVWSASVTGPTKEPGMVPSARPRAASRIVAILLLLAAVALLAAAVAYLTVPAYGLPRFLPHDPSSIRTSPWRGGGALAVAAVCLLGAWLAVSPRPAGRAPGR